MYGSSYKYIFPQYSIDCSSIEHFSEGTRNAPWGWQRNAETCRSYHTQLINWMNNWFICWFFTHIFTRGLIFKGITARRLYKSFGVTGLIGVYVWGIVSEWKQAPALLHLCRYVSHHVLRFAKPRKTGSLTLNNNPHLGIQKCMINIQWRWWTQLLWSFIIGRNIGKYHCI
jgi:hypothetical protein